MHYYLVQVKNYYLTQNFHNENCKEVVRNLFNNIFSIIDFNDVFVQQDRIVIDCYDLKKIHNVFAYYYKSIDSEYPHSPIELLPCATKLKNKDNDYILKNFTVNFVKNFVDKGKTTILQKNSILVRHLKNLNDIHNKRKVLSFDFEYRKNTIHDISEIGFSIYYPKTNKFESFHYIVNNYDVSKKRRFLSKNFLFGESQNTHIITALNELRKHIKDADYIVGHDIINEFNILNIFPDWEKIIDTKYCDLILNKRSHYCSLEDVLKDYNFKPQFLHNSGNDARLALELILCMKKETNLYEYKEVV